MSFLSSWMLWGFGAIVAPVLIHLWQRRRVIRLPFSTLRFLKIVAAKTNRSARLENILLLFLRCLLFALLILAVAQPALSTKMAKFFGGAAPRTVILAVDNSMSMGCLVNGSSRLEVSKKEALAVLDDLKPADEVAVIAAGGPPQLLVPEPTLDHALARQMIEGIKTSETLSDLPSLFRQVVKVVARKPERFKELYLFSDCQESAWNFDPKSVFDDGWGRNEFHVVVVRPDDLDPPNMAVTAVKITSPMVVSGSLASGVVSVENFSGSTVQNVIEIRIGGERLAQKAIDLAPGTSVDVPFEGTIPQVQGRWAQGTAKIQADNLTPDDTFFFAVPICQRPHVLLVEGQQPGEERLRSGFYLKKALEAGETGAVPPSTIAPTGLDETSLEDYSAVFLADVATLSDRALVRLERYLQGGGTVAFFPGDLTGINELNHFDFLPATPIGEMDLPAGRLATLISEPTHPLIARTWDKSFPFPALPQRKLIQWKPKSGEKTLLTFSNGTPFVIASTRGSGRVFLINASADRAWGDFPLSPAFLPLVQQIARLSTEQNTGNSSRLVGESLPMTPNLPTDKALTVKSPDGNTVTIPVGEKSILVERAETTGLYTVTAGKDEVLQIFAVNADRRESNLKPIPKEALQKVLPSESVTGLDGVRLWLSQSHGIIPIWPALLLSALAVFALEGVLSNLLAKNRSQGNGEHIRTGRLNKRRFGVAFRPMLEEVER